MFNQNRMSMDNQSRSLFAAFLDYRRDRPYQHDSVVDRALAFAAKLLQICESEGVHPTDAIQRAAGELGSFLTYGAEALAELAEFRSYVSLSEDDQLRHEGTILDGLIAELTRTFRGRVGSFLNSISEGVISMDREWCITYASEGACRIGGVRPEDILGQSLWRLLPEARGSIFDITSRRAMETQAEQCVEDYYEPHGAWYRCKFYPGADGMTVIIQDVTNDRIAAMRKEQVAAIVNCSPDAMLIVTGDGRIVKWSGGAPSIFGIEEREALGRSLADVTGISETAVERLLADLAVGEVIRNREIAGRTKTEDEVMLSVSAAQLNCPFSSERSYAVTMRDITDSHRLRIELLEAKERSETHSRAKTEFLANMSHEIRTPLSVILGYASLLEERSDVPSEMRETISVICRNAAHLSMLIDDLLDLSRIESGHAEVKIDSVELRRLIDDVGALIRPKAEEKGLKLTIDYEGRLPQRIKTDPRWFRQILLNLLGNAVKFTRRGSIHLTCRACPGNSLEIDVLDTGRGISREIAEKIFQPFERGDADSYVSGSGLGLLLARRLAELLGGQVQLVRSELGVGSLFRVILPLEAAAQESAPKPALSPRVSSPYPLAGLKVLLAEDTLELQRLTQFHLSRAGATVEACSRGDEAVERALTGDYAAVLMDIEMPGMDGYEATRRLRQAGFSRPIIALTAHALSSEREKCLSAGCDDFVSKPIDDRRLVSVLLHHVAR